MRKVAVIARLSVVTLGILITLPVHVEDARASTGCADRSAWLLDAEREIHDMLGTLTTLRDATDLARLAAIGYGFYPHQQTSVRDMGWAVLDVLVPHDPAGSQPVPGRPSALTYRPEGLDVVAPRDGFDFPYELAGWAYFFPFDFDESPTTVVVDGVIVGDFSCIERDEWFVHERGSHRFDDGGMTGEPPQEEFHGTAPGGVDPQEFPGPGPGDYRHARAWDVHVWATDGVPAVSMLAPAPILGIDAHIGTSPTGAEESTPLFYYPRRAADLGVSQGESADPVRVREALSYTVRVTNAGPDPATGVMVTDVVSKGAQLVGVTSDEGSCTVRKSTATCVRGTLAVGDTWTLTLAISAPRPGEITNSASVEAREFDLKESLDPTRGWESGASDNATTEHTAVVR